MRCEKHKNSKIAVMCAACIRASEKAHGSEGKKPHPGAAPVQQQQMQMPVQQMPIKQKPVRPSRQLLNTPPSRSVQELMSCFSQSAAAASSSESGAAQEVRCEQHKNSKLAVMCAACIRASEKAHGTHGPPHPQAAYPLQGPVQAPVQQQSVQAPKQPKLKGE